MYELFNCKLQDLLTFVHQQAATIKQLSFNDNRHFDLIQQLEKENKVSWNNFL